MSGFKQFILRGNVVDMAVGVVVGGAFTAVVAALTKDLLTPLMSSCRQPQCAPSRAGNGTAATDLSPPSGSS
jgi:large-conductance mechanosensitive channel